MMQDMLAFFSSNSRSTGSSSSGHAGAEGKEKRRKRVSWDDEEGGALGLIFGRRG